MLEGNKLLYLTILLFSYIDEGRKLKLIKYNKKIQNEIGINIINYKMFKGRYIIYESKSKGKEYNSKTYTLKYEGEYLNGQRNGKGKEYNLVSDSIFEDLKKLDGNLVFEGEYLKGKKWNGKIYDDESDDIYEINNGKGYLSEVLCYLYDIAVIFEGEYLNGKRNGKGKEFYAGNLIFEGEYLNGKRNGKGKGYFQRKLEFEGEYYNGKRWNGKGYHKNGNIKYEVKDGKRIVIDKNYIYDDGEFEIDLLNGDKNGIEKGDNFAFKMEGELFQWTTKWKRKRI